MYPEHNNHEYDDVKHEYVKKTQWVINTDGTNLEDVLIHPDVNPLKTISNDIQEVYDCLGLEAASKFSQRNIRCIYFCRLICKFPTC